MKSASVEITNKQTSQNAPLEYFLTQMRTKKILPWVKDKRVLDFGCGLHYSTLKAMGPHCQSAVGFDISFPKDLIVTKEGFRLVKSLDLCGSEKFDCVTSLACFEHLTSEELIDNLHKLADITTRDAHIVGTVPSPSAKPVLEFLSYKLHLIDESQSRDHKVYYDRISLGAVLSKSPWYIAEYSTFQFGFNSLFVFRKKQHDKATSQPNYPSIQ